MQGVQATVSRSTKCRAPKAPKATRGYLSLQGISLSSRLGGLGSIVSSHAMVRGGAPAANTFWHILQPQNASGRENVSFLPNAMSIISGPIESSTPRESRLIWRILWRHLPTLLRSVQCFTKHIWSSNKQRKQRPNPCIIGDAILPQPGTKLTKKRVSKFGGLFWHHFAGLTPQGCTPQGVNSGVDLL